MGLGPAGPMGGETPARQPAGRRRYVVVCRQSPFS